MGFDPVPGLKAISSLTTRAPTEREHRRRGWETPRLAKGIAGLETVVVEARRQQSTKCRSLSGSRQSLPIPVHRSCRSKKDCLLEYWRS